MNCKLEEKIVIDLVDKYGSPLYVFHVDDFIQRYSDLLGKMQASYSKYNIAYSYKTNYTPKICELVKRLGGLAEVVSDMEYSLAKKIGYTDDKIIFNGPLKGDVLETYLKSGGKANVDNLDELNRIIKYSYDYPDVLFNIAFRVNIDIGQGFVSRFGLDAYEDISKDKESELNKAFEMVNGIDNIKVVGLHCHIGKSRSLEAWSNRVKVMFALIDRYFDEIPEFIDFGSGMNSVMEASLAKQFDSEIPSFSEYANILCKAVEDRYSSIPYDKKPWLYTEPGTTLISGCMSFISTVKSIKRVKNCDFVTFDCSGGNMGDICKMKNLPISIYHNGFDLRKLTDAMFAGYTCLENDYIYRGYTGELAVGDFVQFRNVGSYSNVFKPPFIMPNCSMVQIDDDGNSEIIKDQESFDDIFGTYHFINY